MNLLSIDHGNEYIKTLHNVFPSAVKAYDKEPPMAKEWVLYDGTYYCLSNDPSGYKRDKTLDETYLVLTMFAIAKEAKHINLNEPIDLAVDLPPLHFGVLKDSFIRYFKEGFNGRNSFVYHNKADMKCQVKVRSVKVFPQGFAAIAAYLPGSKGNTDEILKKYHDFLMIDIGGYTVDVIPFEDELPVPDRSSTREMGILRMCGHIKDAVCGKTGHQVSFRDIQRVARNEETMLDAGTTEVIKHHLQTWSDEIISAAAEKVEDISVMPVVFIGGGASLLEPYLSNNKVLNLFTFSDDQKANVKGCELLAGVR